MGFKIHRQEGVSNGEHVSKISDVKEAQGLYGPMLKFLFTITEGKFIGQEVSMLRPAKLIPGNKLDRTLQDLGVDTTTIVDDLDVDILKGKDVMIKVETRTSSQGRSFSNAISVRLITPAEKRGITPGTGIIGKPEGKQPQAVTSTPIDEVPF